MLKKLFFIVAGIICGLIIGIFPPLGLLLLLLLFIVA